MTKGHGSPRSRGARRSFADIVMEVQATPAPEPRKRRPGVWGTAFVDDDGREYELVAEGITSERALTVALLGGRVVWDECGCGGGCGWDWCTEDDVAAIVKSGPPVISTSKSRTGVVSEFRSDDGAVLLLAQGWVWWGDRLA